MKEFSLMLAQKFKESIELLKTNTDPQAQIQIVWVIYIFSKSRFLSLFLINKSLVEVVCEGKIPGIQKQEANPMITENLSNGHLPEEAEIKGDIVSEVFKFFLFIYNNKTEENRAELVMLEEASLHFVERFAKVRDVEVYWQFLVLFW